MSKFHYNIESGKIGVCRAAEGNCPLGGEVQHFATVSDAQKFVEEYEANKNSTFNVKGNEKTISKILKNNKTVNLDDFTIDKDKSFRESSDFKNLLNEEELSALKDYLDVDYCNINNDLWEGRLNNKAEIINNALSKNSINNSQTLYRKPPISMRATREDIKELIDGYKVGETINFKGLTSTTTDPNVLMTLLVDKPKPSIFVSEEDLEEFDESYKNIIYEIRSKKATPLSALSGFPQESEYLIRSDSNFTIKEVHKDIKFTSSKDIHGNDSYPRDRVSTVIVLEEC